jgi:large subunit ribosomal protein L21
MRGKIAALVAAVTAAAGTAGAAVWARGRKQDGDLDLEVAEPRDATVAPKAAAPVEPSPPGDAATPAETSASDDLTAIKGLGKVKAAKLVAAGVTTYAQIAAWTEDDISQYGLQVNTSPGQIKREDWVGQARTLAGS